MKTSALHFEFTRIRLHEEADIRSGSSFAIQSTTMEPSNPKPKTIRSFDLEFKLKVLEYAREHTGEAAARKFNVDGKRIREWKKQKDELGKL